MDPDRSGVLQVQLGILEGISRAIRVDSVAGLIAGLAMCGLAGYNGAGNLLVLLAAVPIAFTLIMWLASMMFLKRPPALAKVTSWESRFVFLSVATGLSWGGLVALAHYFQAPTSVVYFALGLISILSLLKLVVFAGVKWAAIGFAVAACVPASLALASSVTFEHLSVAALILFGVALVYIGASMLNVVVRLGIDAETRRNELQNMLDQRRTQVEKLNVALKTNEDKRQQVETNLRKASADLGLAEGKAHALATTLERVSPICQVTGLANRRHFDQNLDSEWRRAMREDEPVSIVIVGIDEYESYIDANGNQAAETLLKRVGQTIKGFGRRAGDMAGRFEDQTLALLLPGCDSRNAQRMAEALRRRVEGSKIAHPAGRNHKIVTAHIAVATSIPGRGLPSSELLKRAEVALYESKFQGGNKVVTYKPLSKLKLERWDVQADGRLNEQSLMQKLLVWGYDTTQRTLQPNDPTREHQSDKETVIALLTGEVILELEGHNLALKAGDSVFVPKNVVLNLKLASAEPSIIFTAVRNT